MAKRSTPADLSAPVRYLAGGFTALMGLAIDAMALGVIPVPPSSVYAPAWVILTAGSMFALVGLWIFSAGTPIGNALERVVGPVVLVGLLSMLHWVAFGPGVRQCSGGLSLPFISRNGPVGDLECRVAFGYGALLFDGILVSTLLAKLASTRLEGRARKVADGASNGLLLLALAPLIAIVLVLTLIQWAGKALKSAWARARGSGGERSPD